MSRWLAQVTPCTAAASDVSATNDAAVAARAALAVPPSAPPRQPPRGRKESGALPHRAHLLPRCRTSRPPPAQPPAWQRPFPPALSWPPPAADLLLVSKNQGGAGVADEVTPTTPHLDVAGVPPAASAASAGQC
ncbi:hypothetical protein I4F81_006333 [Pyropia yezoensis]|uniref:Uncharacterized protein n=1 Tax=Pyropia yezoensis TaxID=2788 RepID=A0ACC3C1W5_PYRYE|nr:hypothetical protein I4F81_006333 [Neopyropia yezoensis]